MFYRPRLFNAKGICPIISRARIESVSYTHLLIYQFYNLIPVLNVEENITLPQLLDGRKIDREKLNVMLCELGLQKRLGHLPNQLSGGQQQRVSIGRALINDPAIVLADEPDVYKRQLLTVGARVPA